MIWFSHFQPKVPKFLWVKSSITALIIRSNRPLKTAQERANRTYYNLSKGHHAFMVMPDNGAKWRTPVLDTFLVTQEKCVTHTRQPTAGLYRLKPLRLSLICLGAAAIAYCEVISLIVRHLSHHRTGNQLFWMSPSYLNAWHPYNRTYSMRERWRLRFIAQCHIMFSIVKTKVLLKIQV